MPLLKRAIAEENQAVYAVLKLWVTGLWRQF